MQKAPSGRYQTYPEYKDSGVEWSNYIPIHWQLKKVKYLFKLGRGRVISQEELQDNGLYPVYSSQTQNDGCLGYINTYDFDVEQITWTTDGANAGTVFLRNGKYNCTNVCGTLLPINNYFSLKFTLYSLQYITRFYKRPDTNGAKIMNNEMADIVLVFPPLQEQTQIAQFLDYETAKIDLLIEKQQKLIELLKEKRQAVISHAVTKGLDPNVEMKDSGIEWLGEVPAHWEVLPIKYLSIIKRGASPRPIDDPKYFDENGEYVWTRIADVSRSGMYLTVTDSTQKLSNLGASLSVKLNCDELFLSIAGTVGKPCITTRKTCIHDGFVYFPFLKINNKWLYYIFEAGQAYLGLGKMGTQLNLNTETVGGIKIGLPRDNEIEKIISYIESQTSKIDLLIEKAEAQITLMQERRTALISAAVTGKMDLRHWQMPEESNHQGGDYE